MKLKLWRLLLLGLGLSNAIAFRAKSQISPDGTTNTTVNSTDKVIRIDSGDRSGDNLFHSFEQFDLPNGSEAFFNNPNDIANIFSRITGGNISEIDGLIRANGDANLFLINPAGIIFGEGASLDIGGSFTASTAESIVFADDIEFDATNTDNPPLLTVNMPIGLNYGNNPGNIAVNNSNLEVNNREALALLGGDVTITGGQISAPGGNIELGGVSQAGQVNWEISTPKISFPATIVRSNVSLANGTNIYVQAINGGNIGINAGNLELSGGELGPSNLIAGIASESDSLEAQAGDIVINITNNIVADRGSSIFNTVGKSTVGNAGAIDITTTNLRLTRGGVVSASNSGQGNAGRINVRASGDILADGESSLGFVSGIFSTVEESVTGNAGGIEITTNDLSLLNGGEVSASNFGQGNAGGIRIFASGDILADGESSTTAASGIFSTVEESVMGNAGGIEVSTDDLSLLNGGEVSTSNFGQGNAGGIRIFASGDILADGESSTTAASGIFSTVEESVMGNAGGIEVSTDDLSLLNGGEISASTSGIGDAGSITVEATGNILTKGVSSLGFSSGIFNTVEESGTGNAGGIKIFANNLSIADGSQISVASFGLGNAGNLDIKVNSLDLKERASLFASTPIGTGGNITLQVEENFTLQEKSTISALALENADGGNINIDADFVIAQPDRRNDIVASADEGTGGNIDITTNAIFGLEERSSLPVNNTNDLDASSQLGVDGTIEIDELEANPAEGLNELPLEIIDVAGLVEQNLCQQGRGSEFFITGKGGNAPSPTQARDGEANDVDLVEPVPLSEVEAATVEAEEASIEEAGPEIVEAKGWLVNDRGKVELVARQTNPNASLSQLKILVCHQQ